MDFRILGPLEASDEGRVLALGGTKQRAVLALLLLHPNERLSAERLIDELWGEQAPPASALVATARNPEPSGWTSASVVPCTRASHRPSDDQRTPE